MTLELNRRASRERLAQVSGEDGEVARQPIGAADQNMVGVSDPGVRQDVANERAEPPLQAVADDGVADLLGDGEPGAHRRFVIPAANKKDEPRRRCPATGIGGKEVPADGDRRDFILPRGLLLWRDRLGRLLTNSRTKRVWSIRWLLFQSSVNSNNAYALSFARPLARRLASTLRPPGVAIRARKP